MYLLSIILGNHRNVAVALIVAVVLAVIAAVAVILQARTGVLATHYFGSPPRTH